jgi:rod shape-determining protein MreC
MYRKQVRRRRAVLVALIVVSLVLLSTSFSESESGPLHSVQRGVSTVFAPLGEGAERALKPARDLVNWFDETFEARGENEDLQAEVAELRTQVAEAQSAVGQNRELRELLDFRQNSPAAGGFDLVTARVIGRSPTVWYSQVRIDKGSSAGVEVNDAVVGADGLVGRVTEVTSGTAQVRLITDHRSAVTAKVLPDGPSGVVEPEVGDPDDLLLDFVAEDRDVSENAILETAGWSTGRISSAFPPAIPIGRVTSVEVAEEGGFQRIHVTPFADLREIEFVQVMTGGPERPGVPG